jgi:hypothetical protein
MMAWQIFWQSVLRVFNNWEAALKVSTLPLVISWAAWIVLFGSYLGRSSADLRVLMESGSFPWWRFLLPAIIVMLCGLWIAVGWHRYILLDEEPAWVPVLKGRRMAAYFWRGLLILLIAGGLYIAASAIVGVVGAMAMGATTAPFLVLTVIASLVLLLAAIVIGLRAATALPGAALGATDGIGDAWRATKGRWGTFLALALLIGIIEFGTALITGLLPLPFPIGLIVQALFGWLYGMVFLSILTTLYGHFVEQRSLG